MAFYSIYEMAYYGYKNKVDDRYFLNILTTNFKEYKKSDFISNYKKLFSKLMIINIGLAKILIRIKAKFFSKFTYIKNFKVDNIFNKMTYKNN